MSIITGLVPNLDTLAATLKNPFSTAVKNAGTRPQDFPGGFKISEYVNGAIDEGTAIALVGNMMPMQPFDWSGEQRMMKEYYPGNPEAAVQILGAKEGAVVIKGRLKDKRYKTSEYYGVSYQMTLALDAMRKRGNLLKFGMNGIAGDWIRYGFIEKVDFKMNKQSWIDYEIELFVVSQTRPKNNYFSAPEKNSPSSVNGSLINAAAAFQLAYSSVPASMPQSIAGLINNLVGDIATNVNLVTNFVGNVISTAQSVADSANRALGLIKNARANISRLGRQIDTVAHSFDGFSSQGNSAGKVRDTYKNIAFIAETIAGALNLATYLRQMQAQFESIARTVPKARYKVQNTDTLQNISIKFYGDLSHWSDIYDHNQLTSSVLVAGRILEIPNL